MVETEANPDKTDAERTRAQRVRELLNELQEIGRRTNPMGYTPDDVERLIHETRMEEKNEGASK